TGSFTSRPPPDARKRGSGRGGARTARVRRTKDNAVETTRNRTRILKRNRMTISQLCCVPRPVFSSVQGDLRKRDRRLESLRSTPRHWGHRAGEGLGETYRTGWEYVWDRVVKRLVDRRRLHRSGSASRTRRPSGCVHRGCPAEGRSPCRTTSTL